MKGVFKLMNLNGDIGAWRMKIDAIEKKDLVKNELIGDHNVV